MDSHHTFFEAVFFDMDGLLVDSEPEWFQSEIEVTAPFGSRLKLTSGIAAR